MHAAVLTAILFALTGACAAQASRLLGAARANVWRLVVALAVLAAWAHGLGPGLRGHAMPWFLCAGAVGFGLGGWCMLQGLRRCGSTLALLVNECVAAVAASLLGWLVLGAGLSWWQSGCVALVLLGVVIGMTPGPIPKLPRPVLWSGCAFTTAGGLLQAVSANLSKHGFELVKAAGGVPLPAQAAYQRLLGGCAVALVVLLVSRAVWGRRPASPAAPFPDSPLPAAVWVGLNALFGPVLGVTCLLWALSLVKNPGLVQTVAATATLLSVPLAWRLEGARPRAPYFAGCALALAGVAGLYLAR